MQIPLLSFFAVILIGAILLWTPWATNKPVTFIDALFTSTSATCVTGLAVVDTGTTFNLFGQSVLIVLMEIGGLGIMTLSTLLLLVAGGKASFSGQSLILQSFTQADGSYSPTLILKEIAKFAGIIQLVGAAIFFWQAPQELWHDRLFFAVFHAVSAFCNAGFSTLSTGFVEFQSNWIININAIILIISGGIGFITLSEIFRLHKPANRFNRISLHSKIVIVASGLLILFGALSFLIFDWNSTLSSLSIADRILVSIFHSVSSRTAGFNTVDMGLISAPTIFVIIVLMFIGASPGSAGGGIKTTTAAVIAVLGFNRFLGREKTQVLGKTLPESNVDGATRLFILAIVIVTFFTLIITAIETWHKPAQVSHQLFLSIFFESVSAFATCGLSMNLTPTLSDPSKIFLIVLMFIGRLGPLAIVSAVSKKSVERAWFAEEQIMVG